MSDNGERWKKGTIIGVPTAAALAFLVAGWNNLSNQTAVAIAVAEQHGQEMLLLREDYTVLRGALDGIREALDRNIDDRFRGRDAVAMENRIMDRIKLVERRLDSFETGDKRRTE